MHPPCTPPQRLVPTFRDDRNPRARTWHAAFRKSVSTTDESSTGTTTSRINRKTRAGRAVQCRARFHDGRALGQPSRTVEPNEGSDRREIRSTRVNSTIEKSADWGNSAMHCVIYISTTRPEFGRPTLAERSVYSKCVGPNNGLIVSLPRPP